MANILVYGATGFTAQMIVEALLARSEGITVAIAGRNQAGVSSVAKRYGVEARVFGLDDPARIREALAGIDLLLNCAGPFSLTVGPLSDACIEAGVHYLDISGEVTEFEITASRDARAKSAGVMLLPGVGFGVVPTDCAAALAAEKVGKIRKLTIAYDTVGGTSRGTLQSVLPQLHKPGVVRAHGELVPDLPGTRKRRVDFGGSDTLTVNNPWRADLFSAARSTGAREIETYSTFPSAAQAMMRMPRLMGSPLMQRLLAWVLKRVPAGPAGAEREQGYTRVRADVEDETGRTASVLLRGPEAYELTARAAAACVLAAVEHPSAGYQTPSTAFGPHFVERVEGIQVLS